MRELIAQAEALEQFAEQIDVDPDAVTPRMLSIALKLTARTYRMNAQAEQPAEPVAEVVWHDPRLDAFPDREPHKIIDASLAFFDESPIGTKLYLRPDQRIAALEALLRDIRDKWREDGLYRIGEDIERIEAALGKEG